jgi:hypothetical protein
MEDGCTSVLHSLHDQGRSLVAEHMPRAACLAESPPSKIILDPVQVNLPIELPANGTALPLLPQLRVLCTHCVPRWVIQRLVRLGRVPTHNKAEHALPPCQPP